MLAFAAALAGQQLGPVDNSANLQSARLAIQAHDGGAALRFLSSVTVTAANARQLGLLRAEATFWTGQREAALALVDELDREIGSDSRAQAALGLLLTRIGEYPRAEAAFTRALETRPAEFPNLFNLGLAAAKAGHFERAREAFESALKQRPKDPDCLLNLGEVHVALKAYAQAAEVLARASEAAPARADIQLALARSLEHAGYVGDAALAFDRYLTLNPADDTARRDRAVVDASAGAVPKAVRELALYASRHREDPLAPYYIALLLESSDPDQALLQAGRSLQLDTRLAPASLLRARLLLTVGKPGEALGDLERALLHAPNDTQLLQQLAITHLALDQPQQAEQVLRKAVALAPGDDKILRILGRALMQLNRRQEGLQAFAKARQLGSRPVLIQQNAGALELLRLPADERRARQIEQFTRAMATRPTDRDLKLQLGQLCLAAGQLQQARRVFTDLLQLQPSAQVSRNAGRALAASGQFELALEFFRNAIAEEPSARVEAAMALGQLGKSREGLAELEQVPGESRQSEYHLVRALLLGADGQREQAVSELEREFGTDSASPELMIEAARLLLSYGQESQSLQMLERAPVESNDAQLARAWLLDDLGRSAEARAILRRIESVRPEWGKPHVVESLLLQHSGASEEALAALETAMALGQTDAAVAERAARQREAIKRRVTASNRAPAGTALEDPLVALLFVHSGQP